MNFYAIRQKSTGFYMPRYTGRAGGRRSEDMEIVKVSLELIGVQPL